MSSGGGGTTTQTTTSSPPPQFLAAYENVLNQAQNVSSQPLQQYQGNTVAGFTPDQTSAFNTINQSQGIQAPYLQQASADFNNATQPLWSGVQQFSPAAVSQYESPYTSQVVNATQQQFNNQNQQQSSQLTGNQVAQGAFGGDRAAVGQAQLAGQQQASQAPVIAGLENQGYSQALGEFNTQQQAQLGANEANSWLSSQAAFGQGSLGQEAQSTALAGANAQLQSGGLQQQLSQEQLNVPYQQFLAQQAYPFQTTQYLANIAEGVGSQSGGTSTSTNSSNPSALSTAAGLGTTALGLNGLGAFNGLGSTIGNAFSSIGSFLGFADGGKVPHRASGGGLDLPSVPDLSIDIVPATQATIGHTIPNASSGNSSLASPASSASSSMQGLSSLKGLMGQGSMGNAGDIGGAPKDIAPAVADSGWMDAAAPLATDAAASAETDAAALAAALRDGGQVQQPRGLAAAFSNDNMPYRNEPHRATGTHGLAAAWPTIARRDGGGSLSDDDIPVPPPYVPPPVDDTGWQDEAGSKPAALDASPQGLAGTASRGDQIRGDAKWMGLLGAGLGMLSGRGNGVQNIGNGALEGLKIYQSEQGRAEASDKQDADIGIRKNDVDLRSKALENSIQQAKTHADHEDAVLAEQHGHNQAMLGIEGARIGLEHDRLNQSHYSYAPASQPDADGNVVYGNMRYDNKGIDPPTFMPSGGARTVRQQTADTGDRRADQADTRIANTETYRQSLLTLRQQGLSDADARARLAQAVSGAKTIVNSSALSGKPIDYDAALRTALGNNDRVNGPPPQQPLGVAGAGGNAPQQLPDPLGIR